MFIVYILVSKSGKFYYGHTGRSLTVRLNEHRNSENPKIRQMFQEGEDPTIDEIDSFTSQKAAEDEEKRLIRLHQDDPNCMNEPIQS